MKNNTIILSAIFALLCTSCNVDQLSQGAFKQEDKTTVTFTPDFGFEAGAADTKAFADDPEVQNLYLAVFNEGGKALVEYVKADPVDLADENTDPFTYTATLTVSDKPRVIHFIANAPEEIGYGSDVDAVGMIACSFDIDRWTGQDAYWGYLKLDNGICSQDDAGFDDLKTALSGVKLVRNFAKIQIAKGSECNLDIKRFWVSNFPELSSVAPYNRDSLRFETDYSKYEYATDAMTGGYNGFCPATSGLVSLSGLSDAKLSAIQCDEDDEWTAYTYERETPVDSPLCIIVGGILEGSSKETFYKIDLRDGDGSYIPVLRNFVYKITIGTVEKEGEDSVKDALTSVASGALDTNIELQGLNNMSNGFSKIAVSETQKVVVGNDSFELRYQYIPDVKTGAVVNTTLAQRLAEGYADEAEVQAAHLPYVTITSEPGSSGSVLQSFVTRNADESDSYRVVDMTPVEASEIIKSEVVTVTGHSWNEEKGKYLTLSRTVNYQMRDKLNMTLKLNPKNVKGKPVGEDVELIIGIEDNLPQSVFTIDFKVEAQNMSLTPADEDLPISSATGSNGKPTYYVTKAITWDDYVSATAVEGEDGVMRKYFTCKFKTNTDDYDPINEDGDQGDVINVSNEYFNPNSISFLAGEGAFYKFRNLVFDPETASSGRVATLSFDMTGLPDDGIINVMMKNMEPADDVKFKWIDTDSEGFKIYEMPVKNLHESIEFRPTVSNGSKAYIQLTDAEFINSTLEEIDVVPLKFSDLKLAMGTNDYVVASKQAQATFHMSDIPDDKMVTIYLKNAVPADETMTSTGTAGDYTSYNIPANSRDVSFDVKITPADGETYAYFYLKDREFTDSEEAKAKIEKLKFSNPELIDISDSHRTDGVIGGKPARISFSLDDMPSDNKITITLTNLDTPVAVSGISSISGSNGVYELTVSGNDVTLDVIPTVGETTASYALTDTEFDDNNRSATIYKLAFSDMKFNINTGTDYLLAGDATSTIEFTMEQLPNDGYVTLYIKNAEPAGLSKTGTDNGFDTYTVPVTGLTTTLGITVGTGSNISAEFYLGDEQFNNSTPTTTKTIKTRYTIDWSKVKIMTDVPAEPAESQTNICVYDNEACTGSPVRTISTNEDGIASGSGMTIDSANGTDKYYFKFEMGGVDYISEGGVTLATLASGTTSSPAVVTCNIQMVDFTIAAHKLNFGKGAGGMTGYLRFDSGTNTTGQISFTIEEGNSAGYKGYNQYAITGQCKPNTKIYFYVNGKSYGGKTIEDYTNGSVYNFN